MGWSLMILDNPNITISLAIWAFGTGGSSAPQSYIEVLNNTYNSILPIDFNHLWAVSLDSEIPFSATIVISTLKSMVNNIR